MMASRFVVAAAILLAAAAPSPILSQQLDTSRALPGLRDLQAACTADAGALWGEPLCGPMALVERRTRLVLANDTVPGWPALRHHDAWVTALPADQMIANTSFAWADRPWAMVMLPLPADRFARLMLLAHEALHRDQLRLNLAGTDRENAHLEEPEGRLWLRLELRALAAALESSGTAWRAHAAAALTFRAIRHARFPGADTLELALERAEGIPEYTGAKLALRITGEPESRLAQHARGVEARPTYVRSFAYGTGPAIGLLLDRSGMPWRAEVRRGAEPAVLLASHLRFVPPRRLAADAERRAAPYGVAEVRREEQARAAARAARLDAFRAGLVDGPVLTLCDPALTRSFDPNALVPMGEHGTIYPSGTFAAGWGRLQVDSGGALVARGNECVSVPAPASLDSPLRGSGWSLTLHPAWQLRPREGRAGSFEAVRR